jgi:hypothetical protein|tara:strand:+ start:2145 stop:2537 length:393 start_codon:yes stop_codon:yes gene_type:complete
MVYSIDGNDIGEVGEENFTKSSELDIMAMPLSDSTDAQAWDFEGAIRNIRVTGRYVATSKADLMDNFITLIEAIVDGDQATTVVYHSDFYGEGAGLTGDFNIKIGSFNWRYMTTSPLIVEYDITMTEAAI